MLISPAIQAGFSFGETKMAKPKIEANTLYKVDLAKSVRVGRLIINPDSSARIRGDALSIIIDSDPSAVKNYEAV